jgi:hypothetical protein
MADIAKCSDALCPSKEYCYRFTAPASEYLQSYEMFNRESDADNCEMFWANGKCKYCNLENDNHKMSCPIMKIQVNL